MQHLPAVHAANTHAHTGRKRTEWSEGGKHGARGRDKVVYLVKACVPQPHAQPQHAEVLALRRHLHAEESSGEGESQGSEPKGVEGERGVRISLTSAYLCTRSSNTAKHTSPSPSAENAASSGLFACKWWR